MAMSWYPEDFEIAVDNPGYGELWIRSLAAEEEPWERELAGESVGAFLAEVTERALAVEPTAARMLPAFIDGRVARLLLPALQSAALLAAGGTDRYERMVPRDPEDPPAEPLCVRCSAGSPYSGTPTASAWCAEHGHTPFGTAMTSWEAAQEVYRMRRARWDRAQERERGLASAAGCETGR